MVCNGVIEPEKLPPTEDAAVNHGLRIHLQIINWKMLDGAANLDPGEWGWKLQDGRFATVSLPLEIQLWYVFFRGRALSDFKNFGMNSFK